MKRIVVDVSSLKAIRNNRTALGEMSGDFEFLVLDSVWDELYTHDIEKRPAL